MIVNGKEYNINDLMKQIDVSSNCFQNFGTFMLTNKEIEILERNYIDYRKCSSLKDLMRAIQNILEDENLSYDDSDDLDYVLEQLSERNYYENVKK